MVVRASAKEAIAKIIGPDLSQMVVGAVLDDKGQPICCEMWPGNTTDVKTLLPIVERLKKRFFDWPHLHCRRSGYDQRQDHRGT